MEQIAEWIGWGLLTIAKFVITPSIMIADDHGFVETLVVTSVAASIGMITFYFAGKKIFNAIARLVLLIKRGKGKPKKKFTRTNRMVVKIKNSYGLWGLALISGIVSVPICGILAGKYFRHRPITIPVLVCAFTLWSFVLTYLSWKVKTA